MIDLHTHSTASDGEKTPAEVVKEASRRGLQGISLTDHNGIWGVSEAARTADSLGLEFIEGLEITAQFEGTDVHILGYSRNFRREILEAGLADTRAGYEQRLKEMTQKCQAAGYDNVSWEDIAARRAGWKNPAHVSFDLAAELRDKYGLDLEAARQLTVTGGACHVPYGSWALAPAAAVALVHNAAGVASLAHPGTIEFEGGREKLDALLDYLIKAGLDGIEVWHPFHAEEYSARLLKISEARGLTATGGSDWHGPNHLPKNNAAFGAFGVSALPVM